MYRDCGRLWRRQSPKETWVAYAPSVVICVNG